MDEQKNTDPAPVEPAPAEQPAPTAVDDGKASFFVRFGAWVIDLVVIGIVTSVSNVAAKSVSISLGAVPAILVVVYLVVMDVKYGATLGKMAVGIKVQNKDTGANLDWGHAILREAVGRWLSKIVLGLGYLWMIWDDNKQTWHDKLGNSVVVKVK